jgi:hypothetical protein
MENGGILGEMMKTTCLIILFLFLTLFFPIPSFALSLGPYSGKVIDSQTGDPIQGASVFFFWEKQVLAPIHSYSEVIEAKRVFTEKNGNYRIPQIFPNLGLMAMLESTTVIIYQPGYQAHIVRIWHDRSDTETHSSFKEHGNVVKLDRIPPHFNYQEHIHKLRDALNPIRAYGWEDHMSGKPLTWEKRMELNLKSGIVEREELLRRAMWEERRRELR